METKVNRVFHWAGLRIGIMPFIIGIETKTRFWAVGFAIQRDVCGDNRGFTFAIVLPVPYLLLKCYWWHHLTGLSGFRRFYIPRPYYRWKYSPTIMGGYHDGN
jgi:hypothetical protein